MGAWLGLAAVAQAGPATTRIAAGPGKIVPIPASIPHEAGDMVDSRIVGDLRWIAKRFPILVTDGYSGRLPGGGPQVGCRGCHTRGSDHHNGLAVDIVPVGGGAGCDAAWRPITRHAKWAEPVQTRPASPCRWVGYDGDAGHGCGHHLHLSWEHAVVAEFELAEWVEVFAIPQLGGNATTRPILPKRPVAPKPSGPTGSLKAGSPTGALKPSPRVKKPAAGPPGGFAVAQSGGISPHAH